MVTIVTYFLILKRTRKIYFKHVAEQYKENIKKLLLPLLLRKSQYNPFLNSASGSAFPLRIIKTEQYLQVDKSKCSGSLPSCNMQVTGNKYNLYNPKWVMASTCCFQGCLINYIGNCLVF